MCPQSQPARSWAMLPFVRVRVSLILPPAYITVTPPTPTPFTHTPVPPPYTQTTVKPIQAILRSAEEQSEVKTEKKGEEWERGQHREEKRGDSGKHEIERQSVCVPRAVKRETEIRGKLPVWYPGFPVRTDLGYTVRPALISAGWVASASAVFSNRAFILFMYLSFLSRHSNHLIFASVLKPLTLFGLASATPVSLDALARTLVSATWMTDHVHAHDCLGETFLFR